MLNISPNRINEKINLEKFESLKNTKEVPFDKKRRRVFLIMAIIVLIIALLPWTQNISANGEVTALLPEDRPQTIHSIIPGRIQEWYVKEGQYVKKGDTIALLSEIKEDYFNPDLVENVGLQLKAKEFSKASYENKIVAMDKQIAALQQNQLLKTKELQNKIQQAQFKISADSIDLEAYKTQLQISQNQLTRTEELYAEGLKSLTDLETKRLKFQESLAKKIAQENKLLDSRNEFINAQINLSNITNEFNDKIAKAESEKFASFSAMYETETQVKKLENDYAKYGLRNEMYYITAPQNGFITKAFVTGIGENIKEGQALMSIMPENAELAVEMYVKPMDLPLMHVGNHVRLQFDGWPALVFNGWQNASFGTFGGTIVAIDNFANEKNKYRILVAPDHNDTDWPEQIRVGAGVKAVTLLNNVPIYYEIWRQINGFPPNFYTPDTEQTEKEEPLIKKIK